MNEKINYIFPNNSYILNFNLQNARWVMTYINNNTILPSYNVLIWSLVGIIITTTYTCPRHKYTDVIEKLPVKKAYLHIMFLLRRVRVFDRPDKFTEELTTQYKYMYRHRGFDFRCLRVPIYIHIFFTLVRTGLSVCIGIPLSWISRIV